MQLVDSRGRLSRRLRRRLVLVTLCAAVALVAAGRLRARNEEGPRALTLSRMRQIKEGLDRYAVDNGGEIPSSEQGLRALLECPKADPVPRDWRGPYLAGHEAISDGWGHRFHYYAPGGGEPRRPFDLWSLGRDDASGGSGPNRDIKSWEPETLIP